MTSSESQAFVAPEFYDANSPNELGAPPLPNPATAQITDRAVLQPPLSRRGAGPGLIVIVPDAAQIGSFENDSEKPLDPEPVQKWAEEGYAVAGITVAAGGEADLMGDIAACVAALKDHSSVDTKEKFAIVVNEARSAKLLSSELPKLLQLDIACIVAVCAPVDWPQHVPLPIYIHQIEGDKTTGSIENLTVSKYSDCKPTFLLPNSADYQSGPAGIAHTRSLVFLRKHLGGPTFDLEAIWDEHTYWEFERRSVAQTMATMVAEPYVNHVPTMTGGMGRKNLTAFYRDHFVFCNPPDTALNPISRVVGPDRVVDEFIFSCTHTSVIPWLLPNVPPSGNKLSIPMVAVINIRGDRLYHEHIWWDQGTALRQAGVLSTHVEMPDGRKQKLPVAGVECARLLLHEKGERSNEMIEPEWTTN